MKPLLSYQGNSAAGGRRRLPDSLTGQLFIYNREKTVMSTDFEHKRAENEKKYENTRLTGNKIFRPLPIPSGRQAYIDETGIRTRRRQGHFVANGMLSFERNRTTPSILSA